MDLLLGNEQLQKNLTESLARGRISHFYLISGPKGSGKHTLAKWLSTAVLCQGNRKPCGVCEACRKMKDGMHPDFITVDDPEKKTVTVDLIRQARTDIYIRPNEADHKIYLFPRAQDMGIPGQNALLKVLEEPPEYGVFLLLTDNPEKLLPTVRSRCTELKLLPLSEDILRKQLSRDFPQSTDEDIRAAIARSGGFLGQARELLEGGDTLPPQTEDFLRAIGEGNALLLTEVLAPMEKWKRDALIEILQQWLELLESALTGRSGLRALTAQARQLAKMRTGSDLYRYVCTIKQALEYAQSNVSPAAICGWLAWELR